MKIPLAGFLAFLLLAPFAAAIQAPDVTFIPDRFSVNSSFIMIADAYPSSGEIITSAKWVVFGVENGWGDLSTKIGNKRATYLSTTDTASDNPNPFPAPSYGVPYEVMINVTNQYGYTQSTLLNVTVGGIPLDSKIYITGNDLTVLAWAKGTVVDSISYKAYDAETLDIIRTGTMAYNIQTGIFNANVTLSNGEYYLAFTTTTSTDFGGSVARVTVGGSGTSQTGVSVESIVYNPVINSGSPFTLEKFKITNTGMENLSGLSITVPSELSSYISIVPKSRSLLPNESTLMTVTLLNIQASMNISTFGSLLSGSTKLADVPIDLRVSVIGAPDYTTCAGKADKAECLGGICCGEVCRKNGANCCSNAECSPNVCSSEYKCVASVTPDECEGKDNMASCTGGVCCSGSCMYGGDCCSSTDCITSGDTCSYNKCQASSANECSGKSDGDSCSSGKCCKESCITSSQCCTNDGCPVGTCNSVNECETSETPSGGIDIMTIALIGGGVAIAAVVGFFVFKKFRKKGGDEEELDAPMKEGEGEDEFSDEDFY